MIDRDRYLPVVVQCELLRVARSTVYCRSEPPRDTDSDLTRRLDDIRL